MQVVFYIFIFAFLGDAFAVPREKRFFSSFSQSFSENSPFGYTGMGVFTGATPWSDTGYDPHDGFPSFSPFDNLFNWFPFKPHTPRYVGSFGNFNGFNPFGYAGAGVLGPGFWPFTGFQQSTGFPSFFNFNWLPFKPMTPWYAGPNVCTDTKVVRDSDEVNQWFNGGYQSPGFSEQQSDVCHGDNNMYTCIKSVSTNEGSKKIYTKYFCCYGFTRFHDGRPGCVESGAAYMPTPHQYMN